MSIIALLSDMFEPNNIFREELKEKYEGKISKELSGPTYEVLAKIMKVIINRRVTGPGDFLGYVKLLKSFYVIIKKNGSYYGTFADMIWHNKNKKIRIFLKRKSLYEITYYLKLKMREASLGRVASKSQSRITFIKQKFYFQSS